MATNNQYGVLKKAITQSVLNFEMAGRQARSTWMGRLLPCSVEKNLYFLLTSLGPRGAKVYKSCRSRQMLSKEYLLAQIGVDPAAKEPLKVPDYK